MTSRPDFDALLLDYLDAHRGSTPLPDVVRDTVRAEIRRHPRRRVRAVARERGSIVTVRPGLPSYALAAAVVVAALIIGAALVYRGPEAGAPVASVGTTALSTSSPGASPEGGLSPLSWELGPDPRPDPLEARHHVVAGGVPLSFAYPASNGGAGWEEFGSLYIAKSVVGAQGAEAMLLWTTIDEGFGDPYTDPCPALLLLGAPIGPSAAQLAAAIAAIEGNPPTEVSDVTLGGLPAKHVVLTVRDDTGCDPGFFVHWTQRWGGAFWGATGTGDMISVWIAEVNGRRLFIEAAFKPDAGEALQLEVAEVVASIQFE